MSAAAHFFGAGKYVTYESQSCGNCAPRDSVMNDTRQLRLMLCLTNALVFWFFYICDNEESVMLFSVTSIPIKMLGQMNVNLLFSASVLYLIINRLTCYYYLLKICNIQMEATTNISEVQFLTSRRL